MDDEGSKFARLYDEIGTHPGTIAHREWESLRFVHGLFMGNHNDALALINAIESNQDGIAITMAGNVGDPAPRELLYGELFRLIHNYVAGVVTFTDHTRNLMRRYEGTPTHDEYLGRLETLLASGLAPFVSKLRNYVLHYRLPTVGVQVSWNAETGERFLCYFDRDRALAWDGWPAAARTFLEGSEPKMPLGEVLVEYARLLEELYRWLYEQFTVLHGADIDAVNALIEQLPHRGPDGALRAPVDAAPEVKGD